MHISCKWIAAGMRYVSLHVDASWLDEFRLPVYKYAIARLDQQIVERVTFERVSQIDAEYLCRPVRLNSKDLSGVQPSVRRYSSCLIQDVAQVLLSGSSVAAGRTHFASHDNLRGRLKVV